MKNHPFLLSLMFLLSARVAFSKPTLEEDHIVSNGQGISSPSFWDGLSGENPAGLTFNNSLKFQGGLSTPNSSFDPINPSAGFLIGNGLLGAGIEYSKQAGFFGADGQINWGIAGVLSSLHTAVGVSGHHSAGNGGGGVFDLGVLVDLSPSLVLGVMVPSFTSEIQEIDGGITYSADQSIDLVLDGALRFSGSQTGLTLKPGLTIRVSQLQATAAFTIINGHSSRIYDNFTGGLGLKIGKRILLGYEYQGGPLHRLGLTLKLD